MDIPATSDASCQLASQSPARVGPILPISQGAIHVARTSKATAKVLAMPTCVESLTLAIEKYSTTTEQMFIPRLNKMANLVDTPSTKAMASGPISLQMRSIRRIWAFVAMLGCISTYGIPLSKSCTYSCGYRDRFLQQPQPTIPYEHQVYTELFSIRTQSLSTDTRFMIEHSFSIQARRANAMSRILSISLSAGCPIASK
ncbi:unnamed protein product [Aspergillus oryzae]|nr:unnamed protein product [Aspergillus oryzae]